MKLCNSDNVISYLDVSQIQYAWWQPTTYIHSITSVFKRYWWPSR